MKKLSISFLFFVCAAFSLEKIDSFADYQKEWKASIENPALFWQREASMLSWMEPYATVWQKPTGEEDQFVGRWFVGGKLNVTYNCVDRWADAYPNALALIWISEEDLPDQKKERFFTYKELSNQVNRCANGLRSLGVRKGDRVCLWLPMIPELMISQLACAKIGAVHSVVFSGFSPKSVQERMKDCECKVVITVDEALRRGKKSEMKESLDPYLEDCPFLEHVIVVERTKASLPMKEKRDLLWDAILSHQSTHAIPEKMDAEDPLFILYTSGTTGNPKGIVHSTAGYLLYVMSTMKHTWHPQGLIEKYKNRDVWFCTADIGWITGHSYVTYAPLALGLVVVMYEGAPTYPHEGKLWERIDRYNVTLFYTAPTLIRSLMVKGERSVNQYSLSSLKVLGSVGEPINPEAWEWYYTHVGKKRCPIVDTYWQTETGGYLISPMAGITPLKPGSCSFPCLGIEPKIVSGKKGALCIAKPWPGMMRTIYRDHKRFCSTYLKAFPGMYYTGDEAMQDEEGFYTIIGRLDDVIKVSGHRLGSAEIEKAITSHPAVAEAAVVGIPHETKGQSIFAFVVMKEGAKVEKEEIQQHVRKEYGGFSVPDGVLFVDELPKTRSGKILRRLLQSLLLENKVEEISTLANPSSVEKIKEALAKN